MQFFDLKTNALSSIDRDCSGWKVAGESFELSGNLHSEFSSWGEYYSLDSSGVRFDSLEHGESVGNCLSRSRVSLADDISPFEQRLDGLGLNRESVDVTHVLEPPEKTRLQTQGFELLRQLFFIMRAEDAHKDLPTHESKPAFRFARTSPRIQRVGVKGKDQSPGRSSAQTTPPVATLQESSMTDKGVNYGVQ